MTVPSCRTAAKACLLGEPFMEKLKKQMLRIKASNLSCRRPANEIPSEVLVTKPISTLNCKLCNNQWAGDTSFVQLACRGRIVWGESGQAKPDQEELRRSTKVVDTVKVSLHEAAVAWHAKQQSKSKATARTALTGNAALQCGFLLLLPALRPALRERTCLEKDSKHVLRIQQAVV